MTVGDTWHDIRVHIQESDSASAWLSYLAATVELCPEMKNQELNQLRRNFTSFIQPLLDADEIEDYDLIWVWEKFLFEKSQRILSSPGLNAPLAKAESR